VGILLEYSQKRGLRKNLTDISSISWAQLGPSVCLTVDFISFINHSLQLWDLLVKSTNPHNLENIMTIVFTMEYRREVEVTLQSWETVEEIIREIEGNYDSKVLSWVEVK
jgi:hypothetical protein